MKKRLNCPNCAAPITGIKCEYCGTQFFDFALIDMEYPSYIRFKQGSRLMTCKVKLKEFNIRVEPDAMEEFYVTDLPIYKPLRNRNKLEMELRMESVVQNENDILYEVMEVKEND